MSRIVSVEYLVSRVEYSFEVDGVFCAGTLFRPSNAANRPVIVMAHGFGSIRAFRLYAYAERFARAGYASFVFDYRSFGDSEGEPRQRVDPIRHLNDYRAAVAFVRTLSGVDRDRVCLWGTSFSGGHVLQLAAENLPGVCAVISQIPHVSGPASVGAVPRPLLLKSALFGIIDLVGGMFGKPCWSPIVGKEGEYAALSANGAWDGWWAMKPEGPYRWENKVQSRIFLQLPFYSPGRFAEKVSLPTMVVAAKQDQITPFRATERMVKRLPNVEWLVLDCDHFAPYVGEGFEACVVAQLAFLNAQLPTEGD